MSCNEQPTDFETLAQKMLSEPKSVTGDQGSYVNHSLRELIEAAEYLEKKQRCPSDVLRAIYGNRSRIQPPSARGT